MDAAAVNDEHPGLWRRNAIEHRGWKRGWNSIHGNPKEKRRLKRRAHKQDRRHAREALYGQDPRGKKRTGDGRDVW